MTRIPEASAARSARVSNDDRPPGVVTPGRLTYSISTMMLIASETAEPVSASQRINSSWPRGTNMITSAKTVGAKIRALIHSRSDSVIGTVP